MPSSSSSSSRLPLLLKLAAASLAGVTALLSALRLRRRHLLSSFRIDLLSSLDKSLAEPPSILVTGFRSHGKSSLVNTLCRVLADERGPLVMRCETAPAGPLVGAASARHVVRADVAGREEEEEEEATAEVEVVDGKGLGKAETATAEVVRADVEAEVAGEEGKGGGVAVDCVVVAVRCAAPAKERRAAVRRLADVASAVRARGLNLVVVLTQKKALKSAKQAEELRREVAYRARTDCVYFIENYTAGITLNVRHPIPIKIDFDTHLTVLAIIRQCIEFTRLYRSRSSSKANPVSSSAINLP